MWKLSTSDRLERWKRFRDDINQLDFEQALEKTADLWGIAPFTPYYLDWDDTESWPDPWTLIAENYYCDLAKALGIVYTLYLTQHKDHSISIKVMRHPVDKAQYNLVWIDEGKYVLNLEHHEVVNKKSIPKELELVIEYTSARLNLDRY